MRAIDTALERPRYRATLQRRVLPTLQLGVEWNPVAKEVGPLANWFLFTETDTRLALFFGTSSDRIGSPAGTQSYYATASRWFEPLNASAYVSLAYSEWDESLNVPFGATLSLPGGFALQPMYDGNRTHLLGIWSHERFSVTAIWAWLERAGIAVSAGF